ncbi:DUF6878 family protein [Acidisoma sp. 7E03]
MNTDTSLSHQEKSDRAERLQQEILPHNKQVLFASLSAAGIATVLIDFDGSSDDGCFQQPVGFDAANAEIPLPDGEITIKTVVFATGLVEESAIVISGYLQELATDLLDGLHQYWEDGEGAYGTFRFSVPDQAVTLEFNERYIAYNRQEHQF